MTTIRFDDFLKEQLQDPNFKAGFEVECAKLSIAVAVMQAREHAGLTRAGLAEKAGVPLRTITRIEAGTNSSIETFSKLASAMDTKLKVSLSDQ
ncbi:helix-turn-helix domain-containing protein [Lactiplantibacillus nangangensis]|uniref:Helix-turn-helix domain-containing protein n=1 Tax=Lactiplantibacillus nangangensis TaxID=2559917 RepID=A0ABW1SGJ0_9LACO|nr:helix-turn-helix transcriptional regulator [Lactiplantibacillus nangangensis]